MILREIIRWTTGIDVVEALERERFLSRFFENESVKVSKLRREAMAERDKAVKERDVARAESRELLRERDAARADAHAFWTQRDAARDQVVELTAELETLRRTNALHRSLIGILRDVNRNLDERNTFLEQLHGMTPSERLAAGENDAPDRCTKSELPESQLAWRVEKVFYAADAQARLDGWQGHGSGRWGLGVAFDIEWIVWRLDQLEAMA